jgi:hypothetical protein
LDDDTKRTSVYGAALDVTRSLYLRVALRHQGRSDGRRRHPSPVPVNGRVSTATRDMLAGRFLRKVSRVRETCGEAIDEGEEAVRRLRYDARDLQEQLADVRHRLDRAEREKPSAATPPERDPGDQYYDAAMALKRRTREHAKRVAELTAERRRLEQRLRENGRQLEEIVARMETLRRKALESEHRYAATFVHERAIYDRALLRRHPLGDLIGPLLDSKVPPLQPWQHALTAAEQKRTTG